jgi:hypothetical protein
LKGQINRLRFLAIAGPALVVVLVILQKRQILETELPFLTLIVPNAGVFFGTLLIGFAIGISIAGHMSPPARNGSCPIKKARKNRSENGTIYVRRKEHQ